MFKILFFNKNINYRAQELISLQLFFHSLYERSLYSTNFPAKFFLPIVEFGECPKRKRGTKKYKTYYGIDFLELYSRCNHRIEFKITPEFDKEKFWNELKNWIDINNYRLFTYTGSDFYSGFKEINSIEEFYLI